jgi:class 3 adenylate cyclase
VLAAFARTLDDRGFAGEIWDARWRLVYLSNEYRTLVNAGRPPAEVHVLGEHFVSRAMMAVRESWPAGPTAESVRAAARDFGPYVLDGTPGGLEALREFADPSILEVLEELTPQPPPAAWGTRVDIRFGEKALGNDVLQLTLRDADGAVCGYGTIVKPEMRAAVLGMLALGDAQLFERMAGILEPARRPGAVLFADLENSTPLAKRLATPAYFALIRRIASGSDRAVVDAGGIVGKHVGDGVTAFFLADEAGSESAAARGCIQTMRGIRAAARRAAERSELDPADVSIRFGLHWGATLYVGRLMTSGRAEVTALGDEVNEGARLEACATNGLALASKALIDRLDAGDAAALDIDPAKLSYTMLAELPTATEKARRDAPAIAVCEV